MPIYRQSDNRQTLVKPLSQIQTWIIDRLAYRSFNGLDNTDQIDLWPFFTSSIRDEGSSEGLRRQISVHIEAALEICGPTTSPYQVTRDKDMELSDQAVLFRYLIPAIPRWLANTRFLGRYAITGERYAVALLHILRYLLRLRKDQLAAVLKDQNVNLSTAMHLARETFLICMKHVPQSIELYFLVLFMYSVIVDRVNGPRTMAKSAKTYLLLVSTQCTITATQYQLYHVPYSCLPILNRRARNSQFCAIQHPRSTFKLRQTPTQLG